MTTTVCPRSDLAASEIVSATSEKFSGAEEIDVEEIVFDRGVNVNNAIDDDGGVKPDADDNMDAVTIKAVNDFMMVVGCCFGLYYNMYYVLIMNWKETKASKEF